jgi:hypothetical protein
MGCPGLTMPATPQKEGAHVCLSDEYSHVHTALMGNHVYVKVRAQPVCETGQTSGRPSGMDSRHNRQRHTAKHDANRQ